MKIAPEALAVLSTAKISGNTLALTGQLDRKLYVTVDKVLQAAGGKWNRSARVHVFEADIEDLLDQVILTGEVGTRQDNQQFFTPDALADRVAEMAKLRPRLSVLEPSAGDGSLLRAALRYCGPLWITAIEPDARLAGLLPHTLPNTPVIVSDFLACTPEHLGKFDRILMNPPFTKQADIKHVMHALRFLESDGLLVAIMSAGVTFRQDARSIGFRSMVAERRGSIEALPANSFKATGTSVNTVLCVISGDQDQP